MTDETEEWKKAKSKLIDLFIDNEERGKIRGRLLKKPILERLEYFEGNNDDEIKATLSTLLSPSHVSGKSVCSFSSALSFAST